MAPSLQPDRSWRLDVTGHGCALSLASKECVRDRMRNVLTPDGPVWLKKSDDVFSVVELHIGEAMEADSWRCTKLACSGGGSYFDQDSSAVAAKRSAGSVAPSVGEAGAGELLVPVPVLERGLVLVPALVLVLVLVLVRVRVQAPQSLLRLAVLVVALRQW